MIDRIYHLTHLYLMWLDEGDLVVDQDIAERYTAAAAEPPSIPLNHYVLYQMYQHATFMKAADIKAAICAAVSSCGIDDDEWQEIHEENTRMLIDHMQNYVN